ncbi:uncharacterized protein A4U43_C05F17030 [Asparagus officinalis]|uniref:Cationic amino acid transporter C-terminal domain-containing protein n=1 Tax=Asparagus officinalis TaxID=4686 RepID=A0A5P1ES95_ASPOF|nr:uncharacterized protein A4U43_C05F17030 [Asparagus officinalis]
MLFVIIAGGYLGFQTGWVGYSVSSGYFPYGINGVLAGSATVFFAYIGFDSVASTAEEVKNPQRDLPWGIGLALSTCCFLYMMVSVVIVGLVPYFAMDPDTPISTAFSRNGMQWAMYIVTTGAVLALCSTLMGSILPQPRILMAMSRDGLLPPFFSEINSHSQVPVKSTVLTGIGAAILAFFMDVSELAGMVSVGTLLAFTMVAISILILRYVPPSEVPLPSSFHESIISVSSRYSAQEIDVEIKEDSKQVLDMEPSAVCPLIGKEVVQDKANEQERRKKASWSIVFVCIGVLILTSSASASFLPSPVQYVACSVGGLLLLSGLFVLSCTDQDDARHSFGHAGGFICPFVPFLPVCCILINSYLLINLGASTWMRVSIWLVIGVLVYIFYGRTHSSLTDAIYVPSAHVDEICRTASRSTV